MLFVAHDLLERRRRPAHQVFSSSCRACGRVKGARCSSTFERPSFSCEYPSLPWATPRQHCATAAIMRKRQLDRTCIRMFAGTQRTRGLKSDDSSTGGSPTRGSGAVWVPGSTMTVSSTSPVGPPKGPMMTSPTAGGLAWVARHWRLQSLAPARRSPPQVGVVQVARSIATNKQEVHSSTVEPAC